VLTHEFSKPLFGDAQSLRPVANLVVVREADSACVLWGSLGLVVCHERSPFDRRTRESSKRSELRRQAVAGATEAALAGLGGMRDADQHRAPPHDEGRHRDGVREGVPELEERGRV